MTWLALLRPLDLPLTAEEILLALRPIRELVFWKIGRPFWQQLQNPVKNRLDVKPLQGGNRENLCSRKELFPVVHLLFQGMLVRSIYFIDQ